MKNKNHNLSLAKLGALIGLGFSLLLFLLLIPVEKVICGDAKLPMQTDIVGVPLCNKESQGEAWRGYCEDGILYSLDKTDSCIRKILFFPIMSNLGREGSEYTIMFLVPVYGAIVGGIIGSIISSRKKKNNKKWKK